MNAIRTNGESIQVYDRKVEIDRCLSCPYPATKCRGESRCTYMKTGCDPEFAGKTAEMAEQTLAAKIRVAARAGMRRDAIAAMFHISIDAVRRQINDDVKHHLLTQVQADATRCRQVSRRFS